VELCWSSWEVAPLSSPSRRGDDAAVTGRPLLRFALRAPREEVRCACRHLAEAAFTQGLPKRRRVGAAVIHGQRGHICTRLKPSFCFHVAKTTLHCAQEPWRKDFDDLRAGSIAGASPSGQFPGGGADSRSARSLSSGGEGRGLDCIFWFYSRVFSVKLAALSAKPLLGALM